MTINKRTQKIKVDGKEYISTHEFMGKFIYGSGSQVTKVIKEGIPHVRKNNRNWFNVEQCQNWYAGVI